ncbi:hypothetical protein BD410DRAFT_842937 [Rickenella mellea]|uniref:SAP domain-containing protein n=1 Tax=Rickenella mellea TaxID=50990 RepID=A0A4Y7PTD9_9AGAM|nr:hypothetical protein BD410DRAFT_842937 [Rickenella mellea]
MSVIISSATESSGLVHEDEKLVLPCTSEYLDEGGTIPTFTLVTNNLTKKLIQDYLRQYGLQVSGNRELLLTRLRTFAKDTENWDSLFQPAPGRKRGNMSGARAGRTSAKRICHMFPSSEGSGSAQYPSKRGSFITPGSRSLDEGLRAAASGWASLATRFLEDNELAHAPAPIPSEEPNCESLVDDSEGNVSNTCQPLRSGGNTDSELTLQVRRLVRCVGQVESKVTAFMSRSFTPSPASIAVANLHSAALNGRNDLNRDMNLDTHSQTPRSTSSNLTLSRGLVAQDNSPDDTAMLTTSPVPSSSGACGYPDSFLIDGKQFAFDFANVPDPPTANFADNVTELFRAWCDGNSIYATKVNGQGIPIKHWPDLYKKKYKGKVRKGPSQVWDAIRGKWGKYNVSFLNFLLVDVEFFEFIQSDYGQFIMTERERYATDDDFWKAFLNPNGSRMGITAIHTKLMDDRTSKSKASAADARRYFGEDLGSVEVANKKIFTYKKSNETFVISDDQKVAEIWEKVLKTNDEIAEKWAAMTNNETNEI